MPHAVVHCPWDMAFTYRYTGQVRVQQLLGQPVEYRHFFLENKDLEGSSHGLISSTSLAYAWRE